MMLTIADEDFGSGDALCERVTDHHLSSDLFTKFECEVSFCACDLVAMRIGLRLNHPVCQAAKSLSTTIIGSLSRESRSVLVSDGR